MPVSFPSLLKLDLCGLISLNPQQLENAHVPILHENLNENRTSGCRLFSRFCSPCPSAGFLPENPPRGSICSPVCLAIRLFLRPSASLLLKVPSRFQMPLPPQSSSTPADHTPLFKDTCLTNLLMPLAVHVVITPLTSSRAHPSAIKCKHEWSRADIEDFQKKILGHCVL